MSVDFSAYCSGDLDAFNPFANLEPAANEVRKGVGGVGGRPS